MIDVGRCRNSKSASYDLHLEEISSSESKIYFRECYESSPYKFQFKQRMVAYCASYPLFLTWIWRNALPTPHLADLPSILSNTYLQPQRSSIMIDQRIFENLQTKIDEETTVRDVSLTNASWPWWILRAPSLHRSKTLGQEIRQVANNFDRSYMRLSKHSLEEVCSAICDFNQDLQVFILPGTALLDWSCRSNMRTDIEWYRAFHTGYPVASSLYTCWSV